MVEGLRACQAGMCSGGVRSDSMELAETAERCGLCRMLAALLCLVRSCAPDAAGCCAAELQAWTEH